MDVMIDLETLGLAQNTKMLSIGACCFDITKISTREELAQDAFYANIDGESYDAADGLFTETPSTLRFWKEQSPEAVQVLKGNQHPWYDAVGKFFKWKRPHLGNVWANSPSFDLAILKYHTRLFGNSEDLWEFWKERDFRTLKALYETKFGKEVAPTPGIKHYALDDAINQALATQRYYARLMGGPSVTAKPQTQAPKYFSDSAVTDAAW